MSANSSGSIDSPAHSNQHHHDHGHGHDHPHAPQADAIEGYLAVLSDALGIHLGARLVARAWVDPDFRDRFVDDPKAAAAELGITIGETKLIVLENKPDLHNVIVCTLCSCYPRSILGQPPGWYTSSEYRARTIREPRKVLAEFGTHLRDDVEVRVHDSIADMRYLVLPMRPAETTHLDEAALAGLVTRDSLIGVVI
jgi:nitrile hydratase